MTIKSRVQSQFKYFSNQYNYLGAPQLHSYLWFSSLQILFWLLVSPAAWRMYIAHVAPQLPPNFTLIELKHHHWQNPRLRQILISGYIVWPLMLALLVWISGIAAASQVGNTTRGIVGGILITVLIHLTLALAAGVSISVAVGIIAGVLGSLAYSLASILPDGPARTLAMVIGISLALGGSAGVTFGIVTRATEAKAIFGQQSPLRRQIIGIVIGAAIGIIGPIIATYLVFRLSNSGTFTTFGDWLYGLSGGRFVSLTRSIVFGMSGGIAFGVAVGRRIPWAYGLMVGLAFAAILGPTRAVALSISEFTVLKGIGNALMLSALFVLAYVVAERLAGSRIGAVAGALASGIGSLLNLSPDHLLGPYLTIGFLGIFLGLSQFWWRPILTYPLATIWNLLLHQIHARRRAKAPRLLWYHTAFWDEYQRLPLIGLERYLLLVLKRSPETGQAALAYLSRTPQRWAAQAAQIELDALSLEKCEDVTAIGQVHHQLGAGELSGPASALLRSFSRLSQDVAAAQQQESAYNQRLALSGIEERLDGLLRELTRSSEPYAVRFAPVTTHWRAIIGRQMQALADMVEARQEIDNPYIIGIPLTEQQAIFVGRIDISNRIEQLLQDQRRPPLFLYGQRRMGKTSLLNNLGRLLPTTIIPLFVDLQGASRANNHAGLLYNISRDMVKSAQQRRNISLPPLAAAELASDPFTRFDEWLDQLEAYLSQGEQRTALLALDEFEALDSTISSGRFNEADVLGTLRHLIQHRPKFKVLVAGSHHLSEFQRWASYLINVQVVHISYLQNEEARQLIERPVQGFPLRYEAEAIERVLRLSRGHPFLVQLLCAEIVALKNEQAPSLRRLATLADVETAIAHSLESGSFFFADIERNQVDEQGERVLKAIAKIEVGDLTAWNNLTEDQGINLAEVIAALSRRELIEPADNGHYRLQVPLIGYWFRQS